MAKHTTPEVTTVDVRTVNPAPDFSEVEFTVADPSIKSRASDYANLEGVKRLLAGDAISIPPTTQTHRLYRYLGKLGYVLHKRRIQDELIIWVTKKSDTDT